MSESSSNPTHRSRLSSRGSSGRMYHYLYGSIDDNDNNNNNTGSSNSVPASPAAESDSLVGESLVLTDNEDEDQMVTPKNSNQDFQHLLLSGEDGVVRRIIVDDDGKNNKNGNGRKKRQWMTGWAALAGVGGLGLLLLIPHRWLAAILWEPRRVWTFRMRFPRVDRIEDPVDGFLDRSLFHPSLLSSSMTRDKSTGNRRATTINGSAPVTPVSNAAQHRSFIFPFPTGAFWTNLVLPATADRGLSYPIAVYPYAYKWADNLLQASYPARHHREELKALHDDFMPDLTFTTVQSVRRREITAYDPLSVTVRYTTADDNNNNVGSWESYLVQGSPYITLRYQNASPKIRAFSVFRSIFCPRDEDVDLTQQPPSTNSTISKYNNNAHTERNSTANNATATDESSHRNLRFGVCYTVDDDVTDGKTVYHGVQFILQTQEGMNWMVFASEPITFTYDAFHRTTIEAVRPFTGVLRLAYIPVAENTGSDDTIDVFSSTGLQRLIYHAGVYPTGGSVSWSFRASISDNTNGNAATPGSAGILGGLSKKMDKSASPKSQLSSSPSSQSSSSSDSGGSGASRVGTLQFNFATATFAPASSASTPKALLMLALPHHAQSLPPGVQLSATMFDLGYQCIKGPLRPVLGSSWAYEEDLPTMGFDGDSGSNNNNTHLDPKIRAILLDNLETDIKLALPQMSENVYGFGKQAARLAQLAHIADRLRVADRHGNSTKSLRAPKYPQQDNELLKQILAEALNTLSSTLTHFLTNEVSDYLVYDDNLGGLVSIDGLRDSHADFGNGRYNDHLFHYGYILYACAVLGRLDPSFVKDYGEYIDAIYYDVAYDTNGASRQPEGAFFPLARHKVWFDGHSFASGLFPFGNGKSQESSSEAVNCYYGAYLWSLVRHGSGNDASADASAQTDFARLLLATEIRGARTYWHMTPSKPAKQATESVVSVYSSSFARNYMVGNVGMLDAVCSTWFGTEEVYVHMINFLPITSATGELFGRDFAEQEYKNILEPLGDVQMAWRGYVIGNHAISDPARAWQQALEVISAELDAGLSKTQLLYWIASRKGFDPAAIASSANTTRPTTEGHGSSQTSGEATCSRHTACAKQGLQGLCCPTDQGIHLNCCSR